MMRAEKSIAMAGFAGIPRETKGIREPPAASYWRIQGQPPLRLPFAKFLRMFGNLLFTA